MGLQHITNQLSWDMAYRNFSAPPPMLLHVRSAGTYTVIPPWHDPPRQKDFAELFWCARGSISFSGEPEKMLLRQNEVCFLFPGDFHRISSTEKSELFWFTFDGPYISCLLEAFAISRSPRPAGPCPRELFMQLIRETAVPGRSACFDAGATAYRILSLAMAGEPEESNFSNIFQCFKGLLANHYRNPDIGISDYADLLKCHRSTLTRVCRKYTGLSPVAYLRTLRLQHAEHLLQFSRKSVKEIALQSGFSDPDYFGKVFRQVYDKKPSDYR